MSLTITLQRTAYTANDSIDAAAFNAQSALSASIPDGQSYLFGLGSVGAPSVAFTGDVNTGLYSPGADQLALVTAGTARLTVNAAGLVAILGACTVAGLLTASGGVAGSLTAPLGAVGTPSVAFAGDANTGLYSPGADQLALVTGGVTRLAVSAAGLVAIPGACTVSGALTASGGVTGNVTGSLTAPLGALATPSVAFTGDADTGLYSPGADQLALVTAGAARLTVSAAGNIGIGGSADADSQLHTITPNGTATTMRLEQAGQGSWWLRVLAGANTLAIGQGAGAGTEFLRVESTGRVGIGSTSWGRMLTVKGNGIQVVGTTGTIGSITAEGTTVTLQPDSAVATRIMIDAGVSNAAGYLLLNAGATSGYLSCAIGGTERMRIATAGGVRFNAYGAGVLTTDASGNVTAATSLSLSGTLTVNSGASPAGSVRNITISTAAPSGGADGDVWLQYTA